jgi:hypothetical protein
MERFILKRLLLLMFFLSVNAYSQNRVTVDSLINTHLLQLRETIGDKPTIFIDFQYQFSIEKLNLTKNDLVVVYDIDAKKLKKKGDYFLVRFVLFQDKQILKLKAINFRIKKLSRRKVGYINLGAEVYTIWNTNVEI